MTANKKDGNRCVSHTLLPSWCIANPGARHSLSPGFLVYITCLDLLAPVLLALANVGLVAQLGHLLSLCEQLVGFLRECLLH